MTTVTKTKRLIASISRLDVVAIVFSGLLSLACLARGASADSTVAWLLLVMLPLVWVALLASGTFDTKLVGVGLIAVGSICLILVLQWLLPPSLEGEANARDLSGITRSTGHLLLYALSAVLALCIASHASTARLFLHGLLVSGILCLCLTFFLSAEPTSANRAAAYFRHGFGNSNAAATYIGMLLLLAMAQGVRFFRVPRHHWRKFVLELFDQLTFRNLFIGSFLLLALVLSLSALLLTGSRGGNAATLLASLFFWRIILRKLELRRTTRHALMLIGMLFSGALLLWAWVHYGHRIEHKLTIDGFSSNTRLDVYAATVPMITDHPLLGTGLGSFGSAFQPYRPAHISAEGIIDKAHNSYLEFAAEMGLPLTLLMLGLLLYVASLLRHGVLTRQEHYVMPSCGLAVCLLGALHSLVDFQLQVPALGALFLSVVTVCAAQSERHEGESSHSARVKRRVRSSTHRKSAP